MNWLRNTFIYTLLLLAANVAAGFVAGVVGRIAGLGHIWGKLDALAVISVAITFAIALGVFVLLHKNHAGKFYSIGFGVVLVTSVFSMAFAYLLAPSAARETHNWLALAASPLVLNTVALVAVGQLTRFRRSSSNTSLERTRER